MNPHGWTDEDFAARASLGAWADRDGNEVVAVADGHRGVRVARTGAPTVTMGFEDWGRLFTGMGRRYRRVSSAGVARRVSETA